VMRELISAEMVLAATIVAACVLRADAIDGRVDLDHFVSACS